MGELRKKKNKRKIRYGGKVESDNGWKKKSRKKKKGDNDRGIRKIGWSNEVLRKKKR